MDQTTTNLVYGTRERVLRETYPKSNWMEVLWGNAQEVTTHAGRVLAWWIIILLFFEADAFGIIPLETLKVYRDMRIGDILFLVILLYSLQNWAEIRGIFHKNSLSNVIFLLVGYITIQLIFSSLIKGNNLLEYFFRIIEAYKILILIPFILMVKRNALTFFTRRIIILSLVMCILYALNALFRIEILKGSRVFEVHYYSIVIRRVYANTFGSEIFFLLFLFLILQKKVKVQYYFAMTIFIMPTMLAFGRNAWFVVGFSALLLAFLVSYKMHSIGKFTKSLFSLIIVAFLFIFLIYKIYPGRSELLFALRDRFLEGQRDVTAMEGSYASRQLVQIPVLLTLWKKSPVFGIGIDDLWAKGGDKTYSGAFSDVNWTGVLAAYGLMGLVLYIWFTVSVLKITIRNIRTLKSESFAFFLSFIPMTLTITSLFNLNNLLPIGIYLSGSCLFGIIWAFPVLLAHANKYGVRNGL